MICAINIFYLYENVTVIFTYNELFYLRLPPTSVLETMNEDDPNYLHLQTFSKDKARGCMHI